MNWLSKIFNYVPANERVGIFLDEKNYWIIDFRKSDFDLFFRELGILFPEDAILYLEGTSIDPAVEKYLYAIQIQKISKPEIGTIWPRPKIFHIPLNKIVLQNLSKLAEQHAIPEICDHLHVYKKNKILLQGYDIEYKIVEVSSEIGEDLIKDFCSRISGNFSFHTQV